MVISIKFLLVITKIRLPKMVTKTNDVNTWINILPTQTGCLGSCAPESATNPIGHSHRYEPTVLLQTWLSPQASGDWHSSKSKTVTQKILQYCLSVPQGALINTAHALILNNPLVPVVEKIDTVIHRKNHYPSDKCQGNQLRYPVDSDLSGGYTECKYGGSLGRLGSSCAKTRLVRPREFCFDCAS